MCDKRTKNEQQSPSPVKNSEDCEKTEPKIHSKSLFFAIHKTYK